jgi:CheY-like chemotaxis protein
VRLEADLQHINIAVDSDRLQQVLWNLLSNALKFTEKKIGVVTVRLKQVASHVEIVVADNGKGIKREFLPHLFERFSQEDSSSTRGYGGLGLGLSIAKNLVEAHGGKLSADSGGEGQGASFTVALPIPALVNAPRKVPLGETLFGQEAMLDGIRVLIVDDEADARDLLVAVIGNRGAVTASAASAAEALASLPTFKPDLILSDIGMPGTDGYALIQAIRALDDDALKNVPAIALTAYASAEDKQRALDSGYLAHAPKPFDVNRLIAMIANLALTGPKRGSAKGP